MNVTNATNAISLSCDNRTRAADKKHLPLWLLAAALLLGSGAIPGSVIAQGATTATAAAATTAAATTAATAAAPAPVAAPLSAPGLAASAGFAAIPALTSHVNDHAGMLDANQRRTLDQVLTDYETRTGSQIAVLLINSTAPEAIEQYGIRVADTWKIGRAKVDDGVILIVAKDNPKSLNRLRIEAGRGVQGSLTDAQSKRVLEDVIAPYFRKNDYYGGLTAGVTALTTLLDHEQLPAPAGGNTGNGNGNGNGNGTGQGAANAAPESITDFLPLLFMIVVGGFVLFSRIRSGSGQLSSNAWGNAAGVVIGSLLSQSGRSGGGGFGGGGGGGFSGGGGGFDGGGASGNW